VVDGLCGVAYGDGRVTDVVESVDGAARIGDVDCIGIERDTVIGVDWV